ALEGKRGGVVGNAASAIQFIPEIAPQVAQLTVFQRTPNWIIPRGDRAYSEREKRLLTRHKWLARLYRWMIWARQELMFSVIRGGMQDRWRELALGNLNDHVQDPELRRALTPEYPIGGKRILIHDDYYPALARENVTLITSPIVRADEKGLVTSDGRHHDFDVIIHATGFDTTHFLAPMAIEGRDGHVLETQWKDGAEAYLGLTVSGFPNLFMMYGPNTNLGHNSIIFMIECQANYILRCVQRLREKRLRYLEVRPETMKAFNRRLHEDLARTAWARTEKSWYKTATGKITNNWSGTTTEYWWRTRRPDFSAYREVPR
ncbi:MAG: NAD(P)/FAD-dependent oxidoreductase, partial [Myxococcales bacterium]|nr:NAD(P)/FAD-dependent oxidoreductase [Myxococcales bacterium]